MVTHCEAKAVRDFVKAYYAKKFSFCAFGISCVEQYDNSASLAEKKDFCVSVIMFCADIPPDERIHLQDGVRIFYDSRNKLPEARCDKTGGPP